MGIKKNTVVRGCLVPSLKNKPLDGRQDVPTLADIVKIENPYVNFIFPVAETGKWYKVVSLRTKVMGELEIPDGEVDEYEEFGKGMTDEEKQQYLTKSFAEQTYLTKEDANETYLTKEDANETYLTKEDANETYLTKEDAIEGYQPKGDYQPKGNYATKEDLRNAIGGIEIPEEVHIGTSEPTDDSKLWVDTSVISDGGGNGGGSNTPGGDGGSGETKKYETVNVSILADNGASITADVTVNGETKSVTSGSSVPWEVEYGTEYTIEVADVEGFDKPESMTFTAGQSTRNVELVYDFAGPYITTVRLDQTISDPTLMVSRIVDEGGIEKVRENSHRYMAKKTNEGEVTICQLDDNDGTKYHDGSYADLFGADGDVFMKLPKFYWKCDEKSTDIWHFSIAYGAKPDETYSEWEGNDLIGVYKGSLDENGNYRSISNKELNIEWGHEVLSSNDGYTYVSWEHHCMMAMLFYTYYGRMDSSNICGEKTTNQSVTGQSNKLGMNDTTPETNNNGSFVNFWGVENWWASESQGGGEVVMNVTINEGYIDGKFRVYAKGANGWKENISGARIIQLDRVNLENTKYPLKMMFGDNIDLVPTDVSGTYDIGFCSKFRYPSSEEQNQSLVRGKQRMIDCDIDTPSSVYMRLCFIGNIVEEKDVEAFRLIEITN